MILRTPLHRTQRDDVISPMPDPGRADFFKAAFRQTLNEFPFISVRDFTERQLWGLDEETVDPEVLNEEFGIEGNLVFDRPLTRGQARFMKEKKVEELNRLAIMQSGMTSPGRVGLGLLSGLGAAVTDPISLGTMFVPVVNEAKYAKMVQAFGGSALKARIATGALEGLAGAMMVEPFVIFPQHAMKTEYDYKDAAANLGFSVVGGAAMHTTLGALGDGMKNAGRMLGFDPEYRGLKISPDVEHKAYTAATDDFLNDRPVTSASKEVELDEVSVREQAKWDAKVAREQAVRELGFEPDQPDSFTLYPDKSVADPKPNEPWYHGRPEGQIGFEKGRPAWFTRDTDMAWAFTEDFRSDVPIEDGQVFVSNLELKNPATDSDLMDVADLTKADLDELGLESPKDILHEEESVEALIERGFDGYIGKESGVDSPDIAVVFSPDQIKTPGRRPQKTDTGILFEDGREAARSLKQRTRDLQEAKIKNHVEKQRREFKKRQTEIDNARKPVSQEPAVSDELAEITAENELLERSLGELAEEDIAELRAVDELLDPETQETAVRTAIDCLLENM